jgi:predicted nucleic acid-binding protein
LGILIDSSVYIDWLRKRFEFIPEIVQVRQSTPVYTCGIIQAEVSRGILHTEQRQRFLEFTDLLDAIHLDEETWNKTGNLAWTLDRKGITLPLTDIAIAVCAQKVGAKVITLDSDFKKIPGISVAKSI